MVGGSDADVERALPVFDALRPEGERADGFVHAGPVGAGHYAKMVHNGIEYGLMQAYAEGYELLEAEDLVTDVHGVLRAWTKGTVVRSWLLDLLVKALGEDPDFAEISGYTEDSGEGRWTVRRGDRPCRARAGDLRRVVRAVRVPSGRFPRDEGRLGAAQPVRWSRREEGGRRGRSRFWNVGVRSRTLAQRLPFLGRPRSRPCVRAAPSSSDPTVTARPTCSRRSATCRPSSSHRVSSDAPLIRTGTGQAFAGATVVNAGRELTVDLEFNEGKSNRARINQSPTRRPREILGILQTVLFAPEDLSLVRGDPGDRRRYLDELLTSRIPRMAAVRADYDRVLRQRSALLKTAGGALRRVSRGAASRARTARVPLPRWRSGTDISPHTARELLAGRLAPRRTISLRTWPSRTNRWRRSRGPRASATARVWARRCRRSSPNRLECPMRATSRCSRSGSSANCP